MIDTLDLEESLLGTILINPKLIEQLSIDEKFFQNKKTINTLLLFKKQYKDYKVVDFSGLIANYSEYLKDGISVEYLISLMDQGIESHFEYYQESLFKHHIRRLILLEMDKFKANKITQDVLLENIHKLENNTLKNTSSYLDSNQIYELISKQNKKINFRFKKLSTFSNIQEHDLVVIAARPGIGKTGFALNLLEDLSTSYKCLYFNMEMTEQQMYKRLVSINSSIAMSFHNNSASDYQLQKIKDSCHEISKKNLEIITGSQNIRTIRSKVIRESSENHTIVFIDYIGLINDVERGRSSYERVTDFMKELRRISLDYNCTIFVLAQVNRNSEKEKDKMPKISDLKESGELEQSATTVLLLHDENYYKAFEKRNTDIQLIIGKNRNGQKGLIEFTYDQSNQRFEEKKNY